MQAIRSFARRATIALAMAVTVLLAVPRVDAQAPSAEQLEMLRNLPPEQREALLKQLGIADAATTPAPGTTRPAAVPGMTPRTPGGAAVDAERIDPRLKADDSVLIDIDFVKDKPARVESQAGMPTVTTAAEPAPEIEPLERRRLQALIDLVRSRNPYLLDRSGALLLPGYAPIPLAGLDEAQATRRLAAEPSLLSLQVKLTRLPLTKLGVAGLKPFGYDLFNDAPTTFAPVTDVPVPADYIVGAGDQLNVQLYGSQNRSFKLVVSRDGRINFPELGPIDVGGLTFNRLSQMLEARVARQMIGVHASVSMGDTRAIRVFVLGEANHPGSYTISGLSSLTAALFAAGGVKPIGSLRDIQLKRQGAIVRRLDLYDLLIRGDTSNDAKLLPGDVIFIPPVGSTVAVEGEVRRPAIYEVRGETSVSDVVHLAGGLTADADPGRVALVRVNEQRQRVAIDVPLSSAEGRRARLRNGDSLRVLRLRPTLDSGVTLQGHVFRPGVTAWHEGLRLTDVLGSIDELKPNADLGYVLIRRESPPDRQLTALSADLAAALRAPVSKANPLLSPRDSIIVFDSESGRREVLEPLLQDLKRQSRLDQPAGVVRIDGRVKAPGDYPLETGMRVSDLLRAGGSLQDSAYGAKAELTRYRVEGDVRQTELITVDLAAVRRGDANVDIVLQPYDFLNIKEVPEWSELEQVTLTGEVRFPGTYPIKRGETLKSVIDRAGGLTTLAFARGSVFTRKDLRIREQEQLDRLADRLQNDLAASALQATQANQGQAAQALSVGQTLLSQLKSTRSVGRLVIDLDRVLAATTEKNSGDVVLQDGDQLIVPKQKQEVTVLGEVQNATSHLYRGELHRDDYIALSGGTTRKADRKRIYVVRADGSVYASDSRGWFANSKVTNIAPGDTVVVPLDTERMPALPLWQAVTQIIYNIAIAAAAVKSF